MNHVTTITVNFNHGGTQDVPSTELAFSAPHAFKQFSHQDASESSTTETGPAYAKCAGIESEVYVKPIVLFNSGDVIFVRDPGSRGVDSENPHHFVWWKGIIV